MLVECEHLFGDDLQEIIKYNSNNAELKRIINIRL